MKRTTNVTDREVGEMVARAWVELGNTPFRTIRAELARAWRDGLDVETAWEDFQAADHAAIEAADAAQAAARAADKATEAARVANLRRRQAWMASREARYARNLAQIIAPHWVKD